MEHFVVLLDWATETEQDVLVLGVAHTLEKAKEIFNRQLQNEKEITEQEGYEIMEESDVWFESYKPGYWNDGHCKLWIQWGV